jgi:HlyD family secretion protein
MGLDNASAVQPPGLERASVLGSQSDPARRRARERRRALARAVRRGLLALVILAAAVAVVLALRPRPVPVDVAPVVRGPLVVAIEESGMTRVVDRYLVSAPVTGSVSRTPFEPGDPVREGDVLGRIVPALSPLLDDRARTEAEAQLGVALSTLGQSQSLAQRAAVAREQADRDLARTRQLAGSGSLSPQALEQAEFDARMRAQELSSAEFATKVATEQVRAARATLGRDGERSGARRWVEVLAPASGRVLRVQQKSAGVVQAGAPLIEVGDPTALEIVVDLLTTDAVRIVAGTPVTVEGWGGDGPLAGRVRRVEPSAFTRPSALGVDEQRVNVVVALTDPRERWAALADGYRVEARLVLWQADAVTKVAQGAVFRHGDGWAVFRVDGGVARVVPVTLGHRGETEVEILSGIAPGVLVVVHPGDRVKDGARVEPR